MTWGVPRTRLISRGFGALKQPHGGLFRPDFACAQTTVSTLQTAPRPQLQGLFVHTSQGPFVHTSGPVCPHFRARLSALQALFVHSYGALLLFVHLLESYMGGGYHTSAMRAKAHLNMGSCTLFLQMEGASPAIPN